MPGTSINLVAALPAEAHSIVSRFDLERVPGNRVFPLYRRRQIRLIVCSPGKINAAIATAYLGALGDRTKESVWVNIGVAGHGDRQIGEVRTADSITDAGSGRCWYPVRTPDGLFPSDPLVTLDRPDLTYKRGTMVDMEASGFYAAACRFAPVECVQVLKVIADNRSETAHGLSAQKVRRLVEGTLDILEELIACLMESAGSRQLQ